MHAIEADLSKRASCCGFGRTAGGSYLTKCMQRDATRKAGFRRPAILPGDPAGHVRDSGLLEPTEMLAVDDLRICAARIAQALRRQTRDPGRPECAGGGMGMTAQLLDDLDLYSDLVLSVGEGAGDRPLAPIEVSDLILRLERETGETRQQISRRLGLGRKAKVSSMNKPPDTTQINRFLKLQNLSRKNACMLGFRAAPGKIPFTLGAVVADLPDKGDHDAILKAVLASYDTKKRMTRNDVREIVYRKKASPAEPIDGIIEAAMRARPAADRRYMIGVSLPAGAGSGYASDLLRSRRGAARSRDRGSHDPRRHPLRLDGRGQLCPGRGSAQEGARADRGIHQALAAKGRRHECVTRTPARYSCHVRQAASAPGAELARPRAGRQTLKGRHGQRTPCLTRRRPALATWWS